MSRRIFSAGLWSAFDLGSRFGIQFVVSIILARLLSPEEFGIYALTAIFVALSGVLVDGGFSTALIQRREVDRAAETAVFQYNLLVASGMAAIIVAIAPSMARIYGYPVLQPLLYCSAGIVLVNALGAVPGALLNRRMEFSKLARAGLSSSMAGALAGVSAAVAGLGIWSFPIATGTSGAVQALATWWLSGWRPRWRFNLKPAREMVGFGSLLTVSGVLEVGYSSGYPLVIARLYGASDVGFYNRGQALQALPSSVISGIVQRVLLPVLSAKADDAGALKQGAKAAVATSMLFTVPLMLFLGLFSELVIEVLYGSKWTPAAPILTILALSGALFPLHVINLQILLALGRADWFFKVEIIKKLIGLTMVVIGSFFGIVGLATGQMIFTILAFFVNAHPSARLIAYPWREQLRDVARIVLVAVVTTGLVRLLAPALPWSDLINLIVLAALAGCSFAGAALLFRVGPARDLVNIVLGERLSKG